jgi:hypothetical protein
MESRNEKSPIRELSDVAGADGMITADVVGEKEGGA